MTLSRCKICGGPLVEFIKEIFDDRHGYPGRFDIYRCTACGFGQTLPELPADRIGEVYTRYYPRKHIIDIDAAGSPVQLLPPFKRWLKGVDNTAHYHIRKGTTVLDVGCGDCTSIREISAMGAEAYGIEPDRNIKELVSALGLKVHIGLFQDIPYPRDFFDYITMSQVLEHIHDPIELLTAFHRILKADGRIIIGVPNVDSRLRKKYGSRWLNWHVPYHINHFSRRSLEVLAERSGFKVTRVATYTPNLWVELQIRLADYPVHEGKRVPFMNGESETEDPLNMSLTRSRLQKLGDFVEQKTMVPRFLRTIFLRMVDALGAGESYLIFLEKKK